MKKLKSILASVVATSVIALSFASAYPIPSRALESMTPDILNVDFSSGSAANTAGSATLVDGTGSTVSINPDLVLGKTVATFDGKSGFGYTLPSSTLTQMQGGYTIELMIKLTSKDPAAIYGDMDNSKGFALKTEDTHYMTSYQKNTGNSNFRQCWYSEGNSAGYTLNEWMHITLTCDTTAGHGHMYVNGKSIDYYNQTGPITLAFPDSASQTLYIGGNATASGFGEGMKGSIAFMKMYTHVATAEEAATLSTEATSSLADLFCVDYSKGTAQETNGSALVANTGSTATFVDDATLGRKVAEFDGASGFGYTMSQAAYDSMKNGYTIEALVKLNELPNVTNEYGSSIIGCMNNGVGFGFMGTSTNYLDYWIAQENSGGNYRQLYYKNHSETVTTGNWMHLLVTYNSGTFYYYINGQKVDYVSPTSMAFLASPANILYVGGAPNADGSFRIGMKGDVSYVKIYSASKTEAQISALSANALAKGTSNPVEKTDTVTTKNAKGQDFVADFDSSNVIINFAAMSDMHISTTAGSHDTKFVNTLIKAKQLAGGSDNLKGVLVAGDIGDSAPLSEYPIVKSYLDANINSATTEFLPAIGNHDAYFQGAFSGRNSFADILGSYVYQHPIATNTAAEVTHGNYHTIINGIHFISVYGIDGNHAESDVEWLDSQLKIAVKDNPKMPVIVYSHVQAQNTVIDDYDDPSETRWYSTTIGATLAKYPQVVYFAGHTHATADIWNNGTYTAVGTGCIENNMMFVQVDNKGAVQISEYNTNADISKMAPKAVWTFATPEVQYVDDTTTSTTSTDTSNNNNSSTTGTDTNTTQKTQPASPITGVALPTILVLILVISLSVLVITSRKKIVRS